MRTQKIMVGMLAVSLLLQPVTLHAQPAKTTKSDGTVLFICEHGTVKSLLAKVLFERYASASGLNMQAMSRGTAIDSAVPPWMQKALAGDQFTIGAFKPHTLQAADVKAASYVVSFDVPKSVSEGARGPREQWDGLPSVSKDYGAGRDAIAKRVKHLVDSLTVAHLSRRP